MRGARAVRHAAVVLALLASRSAFAQEGGEAPRADNRARAQQLFDSALADAEAGNFAAACPKFLASQEADPKTSTLLNLGACYEKNGQTASAWGAFREAETLARKAARADWEVSARARAEALEPRLVRLTVDVPAGSRVAGLTVTRDGAKIGAGEWGVAIPVDPGEHVVAASAAGREPWEARATVREASATVTVPMLAALPEAAPATGPGVAPVGTVGSVGPGARDAAGSSPSWWTPLRTGGVVAIGVGAAVLVTGGVLGAVANGNYGDARAQCADGARGCPAGAVSDADSAYGLAGAATAVFVTGAVVAAAGAAIVILAPSSSSSSSSSTRAPTVRLSAGPGSVVLGGAF